MALHGKLHWSVCLIQCVSSSVSFYYCIVHKGWSPDDTAQILGMSQGDFGAMVPSQGLLLVCTVLNGARVLDGRSFFYIDVESSFALLASR